MPALAFESQLRCVFVFEMVYSQDIVVVADLSPISHVLSPEKKGQTSHGVGYLVPDSKRSNSRMVDIGVVFVSFNLAN